MTKQGDWPTALNSYIDGFSENDPLRLRRKRMLESAEDTAKAWKNIEAVATSDDAFISVFLLFPDKPTTQPFSAIYGKRVRTPEMEVDMYAKAIEAINLIRPLLIGDNYRNLISDVPYGDQMSSDWHHSEVREAFKLISEFNPRLVIVELNKFQKILTGTRPSHKYLSKDKNKDQAERSSYTQLIADLNRYLKTPKHEDLALLAMANYPDIQLTPDAIGKAWRSQVQDKKNKQEIRAHIKRNNTYRKIDY